MSEDCGPNNNGRAQEECGDNINAARVGISSILWHDNTFVSSFNQRTGNMWSNPYKMDVPYWTLPKDIEGINLE